MNSYARNYFLLSLKSVDKHRFVSTFLREQKTLNLGCKFFRNFLNNLCLILLDCYVAGNYFKFVPGKYKQAGNSHVDALLNAQKEQSLSNMCEDKYSQLRL